MVAAILVTRVRNALNCFGSITTFATKSVDDRAKVGKLDRNDILTKLFKLSEEKPTEFSIKDIYTEAFVSM